MAGLQRAKGFLRREVGKRIQLRNSPDLIFHWDKTLERGERLHHIITSLYMPAAPPEPFVDEVVDDDDRRFVFLAPVIECVRHNLPVRAKVVIVNGELAGQHGIQLFLNTWLQAVMVLIQWVRHHEVRAGSLKKHPFPDTGPRRSPHRPRQREPAGVAPRPPAPQRISP